MYYFEGSPSRSTNSMWFFWFPHGLRIKAAESFMLQHLLFLCLQNVTFNGTWQKGNLLCFKTRGGFHLFFYSDHLQPLIFFWFPWIDRACLIPVFFCLVAEISLNFSLVSPAHLLLPFVLDVLLLLLFVLLWIFAWSNGRNKKSKISIFSQRV